MSLINEALKSIQHKSNHRDGIVPIPITLLKKKRDQFFLKNIFLYTIAAIIILAIIIIYANRKNDNRINLIQPLNKTYIGNIHDTLISKKDIYFSPATINGVSINVKESITEIIFSLSHPILYQLHSNALLNQISITLDNSEFVATLPEFSYLSTSIANISYKNNPGNTIFTITLLPKSIVRYVYLNEENKHSELVIAIDSSVESTEKNMDRERSGSSPLIITREKHSVTDDTYQKIISELEQYDHKTNLNKFKDFLNSHPEHHKARSSYIALLIEHNQIDTALDAVNEGLALHTDYLPFVELKARIYMLTNQNNKALSLLSKYSPPLTRNERFYEIKAALYQETKQYKEAVKLYQNLLEINDEHFEWWLGLGSSLEKMNAKLEAEYAYKQAISLNTSNSEINELLRRRLEKLGDSHYENA